MQFKQTVLRLTLILLPVTGFSQSAFLAQGDKQKILAERWEILARTDSAFNFSKSGPLNRADLVFAARRYVSTHPLQHAADKYNYQSLLLNNLEYLPAAERAALGSRKPIGKNFYTTPASLFEVHVKDFDLSINPVIQYVLSKEKGSDEKLFLNTRGLALRGQISNKIGFAAYVTDNQERDASYVRDWTNVRKAVPGVGFYKQFKGNGYDYFDARGYITFSAAKYIHMAFGYDKNTIGNGYRSMFLGESGAPALFFKINTRIWKFNYQNLFMELQSAHIPGGDKLVPKKYAAMHHLDVAFTKWLNVGLFEGVIFGRKDHFDFGYLNPVIFYRSIEQQNGSFDNSVVGLDAKANLPHGVQLYGQLMLDEFLLSEIKKNRGWWANKWGIQLGAKYIDAFGIKNLDLQVEHNRVRPFTYSHRDSVANYTHYNQPLAHPLGANFKEFIGVARYQPVPQWMAVAKLIFYQQGRDSSARNFGSNILLPNEPPYRVGDFGYNIGSGQQTNVMSASFLLSYEWKQNFFLELQALYRKQDVKTAPVSSASSTVLSFGVRWNMHRRDFDY